MVLLTGAPKRNKTWIGLDIGLAVAAGRPVFDRFYVPNAGSVLVILNEDGEVNVRERIQALMVGRDIRDDADGNLEVLCRRGFALDVHEHQKWLTEYVRLHHIRLIVLDPLVEMFSGDESRAAEVKAVLQPLKRLRDETEATVLLTHHQSSKSAPKGQKRSAAQKVLGSTYFNGWYDVGLHLSGAGRGKTDCVTVHVDPRTFEKPDPFTIQRAADSNTGSVRLDYVESLEAGRAKPAAVQRVLHHIEENPGVAKRDLVKAGGSEKDNKDAVAELVQEEKVRVEQDGAIQRHYLLEATVSELSSE